MNFPLGVIIIVGVLATIILGLIVSSPDDIIQPRIIADKEMEIKSEPTTVTESEPDLTVKLEEDLTVKLEGDLIIEPEENLTVCITQWDPMCGVDGKTYGNLCMLDVANVKLDYEGQCMTVTPEEDLDVCTMQWDPMCGVDGKTYGNLCMLDVANVKLDYEGECMTMKTELKLESETLPMSQIISIPRGSGVPGCETTTECYLPYKVNVAVGATVTWTNDDTTVHTVTSGNPSNGVDELFDSSIFLSGNSFEFVFDDAGTFDYFCVVHPWMAGVVNVG